MPTTRLKEKLSTLVPSQLPEFVQSDFTTFVAFLEAYYEFLEQDQGAQELLQNARSYNDIDRTIDSFVEYFIKQYCNDIPRDVLYNKKALVKNIQDLYNNKGNEKSYKLLFQILYNKDVDVFYPSTQILRPSDGKWIQKTSFFMRTIYGNGSTLVGTEPFIGSSSSRFPIFISSRKKAVTSLGESLSVHEYFFNNKNNIPVNIGDIVETNTFKGEVVGAPFSVSITRPGTGFKVGDILPLKSGTGIGAKLKVTKVNSTGGILNLQFVSFGIGYSGDFYNFFSSSEGSFTTSTFDFAGGVATINDGLNGFIESGTITTPTYAQSGFFAEDYEGSVLREFYTSTSTLGLTGQDLSSVTGSIGSLSDALIYVRVGAKLNYPGYYETSDGFLSDNIYIEDADYYQPFSYVLKIDQRLSDYKKVVKDILHPAGTKLFGQYTLNPNIDLSTEITATLRFLTSRFQSNFGVIESSIAKDIIKPLANVTSTSEFISKDVVKPREDSIDQILDSTSYLLSKNITSDVVTVSDVSKDVNKVIGLGEALPYSVDYFAEDYTVISGTNFISIEDSFSFVRETFFTFYSNTSTLSNVSSAVSIDKYSTIDNFGESGFIFGSDYAPFGYFGEDYVGGTIYTF